MEEPTPPEKWAAIRTAIASRLRRIRVELYGVQGEPVLAALLGVPVRTWSNYERGVTLPAEILLVFIELTGVEPVWLLRGVGGRYRARA
jgi:DNA-binding transcriptional regulator YiaG